ncbi:phosphoenolpyruvate carboxykinase [Clostridium saccharoperbutylacetonicum]|uniref:phosphoenolpyruvate carboxykinase n=1 Tax=Clostridium saccharoperbutylacetonicum TaxID=36745 RepID=UPI000983BA49|nr:phosphoenolpyruvate carboxykinase [Clostridium saccharoperbutylacetonicum]AQR93809.1 phosphoenolpyruvate carboxykinase [Clostridium saccharoperbutylacetonicum]NSB29509.1 energy-coupling factor transporter ATP-binding protein EcfA2 [Clostridium saccharoperbutylacetonicum]
MKKEFSMSNDKVMINFTAKYCNSFESILESDGFRRILEVYLRRTKKKNSLVYRYLNQALETDSLIDIRRDLIMIIKYLTVMTVEEVVEISRAYYKLLEDRDKFITFIEDLYLFWRRLERYTIVHRYKIQQGLAAVSFTEANAIFSNLILKLYRKIEMHVVGYQPKVYRQIPAGGNACIMIHEMEWVRPDGYEALEEIPFIDHILLETPFITYPKKNTRDGMFTEINYNPLKYAQINKEHWFCYPAKIGGLLTFIYFHRDFMEHGITLCNLFEMARSEETRGRKPDIIYVFGAKDDDDELKTVFFDDAQNDIMLGYVNHSEKIDYFGYIKKMTLTLYNLIMIKRGYLPIHGSMVNIVLKSGDEANVVIMGDSGAGKSESLEAFRGLSEDYISDMTIIFDDMGTFKLEGDVIVGYGTEIGAFVRLDDLDQGYAFKEMDRSIFMNPDKVNARLVVPVASYKDITKGHPVDFFFYANNYDEVTTGEKYLNYFTTPEEAIKVFKAGARMAKGTTTEKGLVESFFANPFGPAQKQAETNIIIEKYFNAMFEQGKVKVGQIKTCLGVKGQEKDGPRNAAIELFDEIRKMKK